METADIKVLTSEGQFPPASASSNKNPLRSSRRSLYFGVQRTYSGPAINTILQTYLLELVVAVVHCPVPPATADRPQPMDGRPDGPSHHLRACSQSSACGWKAVTQINKAHFLEAAVIVSLTSAVGKSHIQGLLLPYRITLQSFTFTHAFLCALPGRFSDRRAVTSHSSP